MNPEDFAPHLTSPASPTEDKSPPSPVKLKDAIEDANLKAIRPRVVDMTEPEDVAYIIYTSGTSRLHGKLSTKLAAHGCCRHYWKA